MSDSKVQTTQDWELNVWLSGALEPVSVHCWAVQVSGFGSFHCGFFCPQQAAAALPAGHVTAESAGHKQEAEWMIRLFSDVNKLPLSNKLVIKEK